MEHVSDVDFGVEEKPCCPKLPLGPASILIALGLGPIFAAVIGLWVKKISL